MPHVLLVVNKVERGLAGNLPANGLTVTLAPGDRNWLPLISQADIIILDCFRASQMTDADRRQMEVPGIPILCLASGSSTACEACNWACDDLLLRPFTLEVLRLRLRRLLDETKRKPLRAGNLHLNPAIGRAWRGGRELRLTRLEFHLLAYLLRYQGQLGSYDEFLAAVWDCDWGEGGQAMVKEAIRRLRRKVEEDPSHPELIVNVWGLGYRLEAPE